MTRCMIRLDISYIWVWRVFWVKDIFCLFLTKRAFLILIWVSLVCVLLKVKNERGKSTTSELNLIYYK